MKQEELWTLSLVHILIGLADSGYRSEQATSRCTHKIQINHPFRARGFSYDKLKDL